MEIFLKLNFFPHDSSIHLFYIKKKRVFSEGKKKNWEKKTIQRIDNISWEALKKNLHDKQWEINLKKKNQLKWFYFYYYYFIFSIILFYSLQYDYFTIF